MLPQLSALGSMSGQGGAVSPSSGTGDSIMGPISQGGPVVNFNPAGGGMDQKTMMLMAAAGVAVWFLSKSKK